MIYKDEEMEMKFKGLWTSFTASEKTDIAWSISGIKEELYSLVQESSSVVTRITCYLQQLHIQAKSINPSHELINSYEFNFLFTYEYEAYEFNLYSAYLNIIDNKIFVHIRKNSF